MSTALETLETLDRTTRIQLLQLACFAAWADLEVVDSEREAVLAIAARVAMGDDEVAAVQRWLAGPPPEIDPAQLPVEHRQLFLDTLVEVVMADGRFAPEECETLRLIHALMV